MLPVMLAFACNNSNEREITVQHPLVETTIVKKQTISIPVECAGRITTKDEIRLSFKQGGIIESIPVDEGDRVVRGQLLARLKQTEFESAVTQAQLGLDKAQRDFDRVSNLYSDSVATLEQYQNAGTALEIARKTLESVQFNVSHTGITSPVSGRILRKLAMPEEIVGAGTPVLLLASTESRWVLGASVSDRDVVRLVTGDSAVIETDAFPGRKFSAVVSEISAMADPYTGTFDVELSILDDDGQLYTGLIGTAEIFPSETSEFWLVPSGALVEGRQKDAAIYTVESGQARKLTVDVQAVRGSYLYAGGFSSDEVEIVISGQGILTEGMTVRTNLSAE